MAIAIVYLCGGIHGLSDGECQDWRAVAKDRLPLTLDPMRRDYRGREDACVAEIVEQDLEDICNSNIVLVNAVRPSWGTAMELVYARNAGKQIVAFVTAGAPVSPWLRYHCSYICSTLDAALDAIS